jgi:predicted SAM-dependent methyltransferase
LTYQNNVTRGNGLIEKFLSVRRAVKANSLIPVKIHCGRLLDIGCGAYPYFLSQTKFPFKIGIDQYLKNKKINLTGINLMHWDICCENTLPFKNNSFKVITMLAVLEHIEPVRLIPILNEIYRTLMPKGYFIITSPESWTKHIMYLLSRLGILSRIEIDEHKHTYSIQELRQLMRDSDFDGCNLKTGHFELGMNIWLVAQKP